MLVRKGKKTSQKGEEKVKKTPRSYVSAKGAPGHQENLRDVSRREDKTRKVQ